jgi:hypothetical protein
MSTPQGMAYFFLLDEKPSYICSRTILQRYSLSVLYFATEGARWTNNEQWLGIRQECMWFGVACNNDGFVVSLNLGMYSMTNCLVMARHIRNKLIRIFPLFCNEAVNNVNGMIPDEISVLNVMQELDLFANSLIGTIPDGISELGSLVFLDLRQNLLTGVAFPSSVTELRRLKSYRISNNKLSGEISTGIGSLRNLEELVAAENSIVGPIPSEIGNVRDLKTMIFSNNALTGQLPSELGLIPLEALYVNDNSLLGEIPSQLFNVASLISLRLDNNFFDGTLSDQIGQLTDLEDIRVNNNNLSGQIPDAIETLTNLGGCCFSDNFFFIVHITAD